VINDGAWLPAKYTCDGANVSPPLSWSGVPRDARELVVICTDPDAPSGTWTHWVLWKMAPTSRKLLEGIPAQSTLASGARQNMNDFKEIGYGGACPPSGTHHYAFQIFALNQSLDLSSVANRDIESTIAPYVVAKGSLTAKYRRPL
jgi:Raf kinase inhibitor-like YbhB/YbcL family protein